MIHPGIGCKGEALALLGQLRLDGREMAVGFAALSAQEQAQLFAARIHFADGVAVAVISGIAAFDGDGAAGP